METVKIRDLEKRKPTVILTTACAVDVEVQMLARIQWRESEPRSGTRIFSAVF